MSRPADLHHHLGGPVQPVHRCPVTGRKFENGHGSLSHAEQSRLFQIEAAIAADMPQEGEVCSQTLRPYEIGSGALPKSVQTQQFLEQLPDDLKAQRQADFEALRDIPTLGEA